MAVVRLPCRNTLRLPGFFGDLDTLVPCCDGPCKNEQEAQDHVRRTIEAHSRHSLTSCPPNSRAMCSYADILSVTDGVGFPE